LAVSVFPRATFTFLGFPPTRSKARTQWFEKLRQAGQTVVFFEAPHRIKETLEQLRIIMGDRPITVCRELTKSHEELVIGPISRALSALGDPKGEFTIVVDPGDGTDEAGIAEVSDADMLREFGEMTATSRLPRRQALNALARKHQRPPNEVYAAIERAKKLG
jgi:16S rRNA (cytidine1402-2'-O)-methyltransferase